MSAPTVAFVGMTHLGLNSAIAGAERGFRMVCFDTDPDLIARLSKGEMPVTEPQLNELAAKNADHIVYTADPVVLKTCDVVYVAPDVATDDQGGSDLSTLERLLDLTFDSTRDDAALVVLSQVPPGFTRQRQRAGRTLIYQVETLIFGRAIERALYPERYIIGVADPARPLPAPYLAFLQGHGNPPLLPMRFESAELAKISINMCLVASVTTANTLAELCEQIGADWGEIVPALKLDKRIGAYSYLAPGLGISGGNLERDLATVVRLSEQHGTDANMVRAWLSNSRYRKDWPLRMLHQHVIGRIADPRIAVLGLAYKEETHSTKNSPSLALLAGLSPFAVQVYDPVVTAKPEFHPRLKGFPSALEAIEGADALVIITPWAEFKTLAPAEIAKRLKGKVVIDPYNLLDGKACQAAGLQQVKLGFAGSNA